MIGKCLSCRQMKEIEEGICKDCRRKEHVREEYFIEKLHECKNGSCAI